MTPEQVARAPDEAEEMEEERVAHQQRLEFIAWRKQQERKDLERQKAENVY